MPRLFTTETLSQKRQRQKSIYQETYDDCSFAFEFVPMDGVQKFKEQAMLEAYEEADGFLPVHAVGYLDISYSKIDKFNRLFYFTSDDADPSVLTPSLESTSYGILGTNGVNPFSDAHEEIFPFSDSKIKAGYANGASVYADNTHLRHDYIRYTAKTITGGYALSDIFSNETEMINGVGDLDVPFNKQFSKIINDLSGCIQTEMSQGWKVCKSLVTGLLDFANEQDTATNRFKRGTKFLQDLAEQSIQTFESEKNNGKGEFWVKFHPGDTMAVRLTYNPENGHNQPARNSQGFLGQNLLSDRSYKIYLKFNKATLSEATQDILSEFLNIANYEKDADTAIGQTTTQMPALLTESLNTLNQANQAIVKSFKKVDDLYTQILPEKVVKTEDFNAKDTKSIETSIHIRSAAGALEKVKEHIESVQENVSLVTYQIKTVNNFNKEKTYPNAYAKVEALNLLMPKVATSIARIEDIVTEKESLTNMSMCMPNTFKVMDRFKKYAELNVSRDVKPLLDPFVINMSSMIRDLNSSSRQSLINASSNMKVNLNVVTSEKRYVYRDYIFASVAQNASECRQKSREVNEHATAIEKFNDQMIQEYNTVMKEVTNVSTMRGSLNGLYTHLGELQTSVQPRLDKVSNPPKEMIQTLIPGTHTIRSGLIEDDLLKEYSRRALERTLDSKLSNIQSFYHRQKAKQVADMWTTNEEVAKSEAIKVAAATAAKKAVVTDARALFETETANLSFAREMFSKATTSFINTSQILFEADNTLVAANASLYNASTVSNNMSVSFSVARESFRNAEENRLVANASLQRSNRELEIANENVVSKKNEYEARKSIADVLRLTATNLFAAADTDEKRETALNSSSAAAIAEDVRDNASTLLAIAIATETASKEIVNGKGLGSSDYADAMNATFEMVKVIYDEKNAKKKYSEEVLERETKLWVEAVNAQTKAFANNENASSVKSATEEKLFHQRQLEHDSKIYYEESVDGLNVSDDIDEVEANLNALVEASKDALVVGVPDATIAKFAEKCTVTKVLNEIKKFDLICTLDPDFKRVTLGDHPQGCYFLRNITDQMNIGNNTNDQSNYISQNIWGPLHDSLWAYPSLIEGNELRFMNRMPDTSGAKLLQVLFVYRNQNEDKIIDGKAFTILVTPEHLKESKNEHLDYRLDVIRNESKLDLTAILTQPFKDNTLGADQDGYYYLRNLTKRKNIGDNTDEPFDFSKQNIYGPLVDNRVVFLNRNYIQGDKLQIRFFNTKTETIVAGRSFIL
jgi:hypothetical protein